MERVNEQHEDLIDLGAASTETRGPLPVGIPDDVTGARLPSIELGDD